MKPTLAGEFRTRPRAQAVGALWFAMAVCVLPACDAPQRLHCAFTDIGSSLRSADAALRARAANCLRVATPDEAARHVPILLALMSDKTVFWRGKIQRPLWSFGSDGEDGELVVAIPASYAVRHATPLAVHVEPLVRTFVEAANRMDADRSGGGLWGDPRTIYGELHSLMIREYRAAGLQPQVEAALLRALAEIHNPAVWGDAERVAELDALTSGRAPIVQSHLERLAAARAAMAAEAARPPTLRALASLAQTKGRYSVRTPASPQQGAARGMTWSRHATAGGDGWLWIGCHGDMKAGMSAPHRGSCNPYHGDTLCSTSLPLLCVAPGAEGATAPSAATVAALGHQVVDARVAVTKPVAGASLESQTAGDAVCSAEFGNEWRMAQFHDAGGWGLAAHAKATQTFPPVRYWVAIHDQPANCWNQ